MYDRYSHPGHDPREPLLGYGRGIATAAARSAWLALLAGLGWLAWLYPVSPAPLLLAWGLVATFGGYGND
jgi:hypothetical protein